MSLVSPIFTLPQFTPHFSFLPIPPCHHLRYCKPKAVARFSWLCTLSLYPALQFSSSPILFLYDTTKPRLSPAFLAHNLCRSLLPSTVFCRLSSLPSRCCLASLVHRFCHCTFLYSRSHFSFCLYGTCSKTLSFYTLGRNLIFIASDIRFSLGYITAYVDIMK